VISKNTQDIIVSSQINIKVTKLTNCKIISSNQGAPNSTKGEVRKKNMNFEKWKKNKTIK